MTLRERWNSWSQRRAFRNARRVLFWVVSIELAYVVLANGVLASGVVQKFVNDTQSAHLEYDTAYTVIPALVHVEGLRLSYEDHNMQFAFDFEEGNLIVHLPWLARKRFSASHVRVEGLRFLFRHKVTQVAGHEAALERYPAIPNVANPPLLEEPKPSNPDDVWSFELDGVDAHARELWFMTYRYLGPARATGSFQLIPYHNLEVGPARLTLQSGTLHNGAQELLSADLRGVIDLHLSPVNPETLTGTKAFEPITATVQLGMRLENLNPVNLYVSDPNTTRVSGGGGTLHVGVRLEHAKLTAGSIHYAMLEPVRVERESIAVDTAATLQLSVVQHTVPPTNRTEFSVSAERVLLSSLSPPDANTANSANAVNLAVAERVQGLLTFRELDATRDISPLSIRLDAPAVSSDHLERIATLIPGKRDWRLTGGRAEVGATFQSQQGVTHATLSGKFSGLHLRLNEHALRSYGTVSMSYGANQERQTSQLDHAEILFNTLTIRARDQHTADWWASLSTSRLQLTGPAGRQLDGTIVARAKNPDPVRQALGIPGIAKLVIPDKPLEAVVKVSQHGDHEQLQLLHAKTGSLTVEGELWRAEKCRSGAFRVDGIPVPVGVALQDDDSSVTWFASEDWLTEHIRDLACRPQPKAIVRREPREKVELQPVSRR